MKEMRTVRARELEDFVKSYSRPLVEETINFHEPPIRVWIDTSLPDDGTRSWGVIAWCHWWGGAREHMAECHILKN